jgi:hypothetical protein
MATLCLWFAIALATAIIEAGTASHIPPARHPGRPRRPLSVARRSRSFRVTCGERHIVGRSQALRGNVMGHVHVFAVEFVELQLTSEDALSVIRRQLTGTLAVMAAIAIFAVVMAAL